MQLKSINNSNSQMVLEEPMPTQIKSKVLSSMMEIEEKVQPPKEGAQFISNIPLRDDFVAELATWKDPLKSAVRFNFTEIYKNLKLREEYAKGVLIPDVANIFRAFKVTAFSNLKMVWIAEEPDPKLNMATGLCLSSTKDTIPIPGHILNMFTVLRSVVSPDILLSHGDLTSWAQQGILLLNLCLTANSREIAWEKFIKRVVEYINSNCKHIVFCFFGEDVKAALKHGQFWSGTSPNMNGFFTCVSPASSDFVKQGRFKDALQKFMSIHPNFDWTLPP
jgi:uracil-DNA glycosylase